MNSMAVRLDGIPACPSNHPTPNAHPDHDAPEAATDQAIAACDGDVRATVRALIVANGLLEAESRDVYAAASKGFARGQVKRDQQN